MRAYGRSLRPCLALAHRPRSTSGIVKGALTLVVNAGSTSLKLSLVEGEESRPVGSYDVDTDLVVHRIVHGGDRFRGPVVLDDDVVLELEQLVELAPLHQ